MKYGIALTILYLSTATQMSAAAEWYAGPDGKTANPGTKEAPWDVASALDGGQQIAAGDTIYLLEGTYKRRPHRAFRSSLGGHSGEPDSCSGTPRQASQN